MALNTVRVRNTSKPGRYADGGGLYLFVQRAGSKTWTFRYQRNHKAREMGLGRVEDVLLADARDRARECRRLLAQGVDPIEHRRAEITEKAAKEGQTFAKIAELYLAAHEAGWRNPKHRQQWRNTLDDYALPVLGPKGVAEINTDDVMSVLEPIWTGKPETASRVRGRIEAILDYATARGWRTGDNPARWKGLLANLLPARSKVRRVEHQAALPWREIGRFTADLRTHDGMSALAAEFAILTAARSGEVRGARWSEIDLGTRIWTVPGARMKAGREHRVPLSDRTLEILHRVGPFRAAPDGFVFPGGRAGRPLSDVALAKAVGAAASAIGAEHATMHGFRSTFRDWCAEATNYPREVCEAALGHANADKVEAAYLRGDMLAKRARLMNEWGEFCARPLASAEVVALRQAS